MGNPIILGAIMPHPPILIPEVGRQRLKEANKTVKALAELQRRFKAAQFDTVVIITPHGEIGQASVPVYTSHVFEGSFAQFGLSKPVFQVKGDTELSLAVIKDCGLATNCPSTLLDHGLLVPYYFLQAAGIKKLLLPIAIAAMNLPKLFSFGQSLTKTAQRLGRRLLVVASADMSHRLTPDAPSGFSPQGKVFDEKLVQLVQDYDVEGILNFDGPLADEAGQDALWSIAILLGALSGAKVKHEVLS
ncbi:AmmeMemoRadiSam system protein B, partial [Candidatus Saganbacteria bacterium]|nr:AmmeMemoRadiSam system protein B [Candidatus Saganbacteria bacterium]